MPTIPIVPQTASSVPFAIEPSAVTEAKLIAAYAEWDGTGASGTFLPCLAIYSDAGVRLGRVFPSASVAAGDKAVVTYAPFPGGIGPGIRFNTNNQGGYLDITTNNEDPTTWGFQLTDKTPATGGIFIHSDGGAGQLFQTDLANNGGFNFIANGASNAGFTVTTNGATNSGVTLSTNDAGNIGINLSAGGANNDGIDLQASGTGNGGIALGTSGGSDISLTATSPGNIKLVGLPTSAAGLPAHSVWNNAGVLNIV